MESNHKDSHVDHKKYELYSLDVHYIIQVTRGQRNYYRLTLINWLMLLIQLSLVALFEKKLIVFQITEIHSKTGEGDYKKASKMVLQLQKQLQTHSDSDRYLHDICHVLRNQQHHTLTNIATSILKQLGQSSLHKQHSLLLLSFIPTGHSITTFISPLDPDVQQYCDIMRDKYKRQHIVPIDWPPRVGQDVFGRLGLLESRHKEADPETIHQTAWCVLIAMC